MFYYRQLKQLCERLMKINNDKLKQVDSTENKVKEMFKLAFENKDHEQKAKVISFHIWNPSKLTL